MKLVVCSRILLSGALPPPPLMPEAVDGASQ